jgi:hypothetical protein
MILAFPLSLLGLIAMGISLVVAHRLSAVR